MYNVYILKRIVTALRHTDGIQTSYFLLFDEHYLYVNLTQKCTRNFTLHMIHIKLT